MKEYFIVFYYKLNGSGVRDFAYSWGESPREASERLYNKNQYVFETYVYENADAFHRGQKSLYQNQNFERMRT